MKTRREFYDALIKSYLSDENVSRLAYEIWEGQGRPNGEDPHPLLKSMKNRDAHWWIAKMQLESLAEFDTEILYDFQIAGYYHTTQAAE